MLALILASLRKVVIADDSVRSGTWSIDNFRPIRRLSTLTVGLVGTGASPVGLPPPWKHLGPVSSPTIPTFSPDRTPAVARVGHRSGPIGHRLAASPTQRGDKRDHRHRRHGPDETDGDPHQHLTRAIGRSRCPRHRVEGGNNRCCRARCVRRRAPRCRSGGMRAGSIVTPHMAYYSEQALAESRSGRQPLRSSRFSPAKSPNYLVN